MDHKFAERLKVLNAHGSGLLARLWNTKKLLSGSDRPAFLADKAFESQLKAGLKKFPHISFNKGPDSPVYLLREEISSTLYEHYYNFVDLMEFKHHFMELVTAMSAEQLTLDLALNYEETAELLDLIRTYISAMILFERIHDRKAIAACFTAAHEFMRGSSEPSFPRLGQLLVDYEHPLKAIHADLMPNGKMIRAALLSLHPHLLRRLQPADMYRKENYINPLHAPAELASDKNDPRQLCHCESAERLVHWVACGYLAVPEALAESETAVEDLKLALSYGFCLELHRTESLSAHTSFEEVFSSMKDAKRFAKTKVAIMETLPVAITQSLPNHAAMRRFLRQSLARLLHVFSDKPALMGPQLPVLLEGLRLGRDEVTWLFRHMHAVPPKAKGAKLNPSLFKDPELPELLYLLTELYDLVMTHRGLLAQYFTEFLAGHDLVAVRESFVGLRLDELHTTISNSFVQQLSELAQSSSSDAVHDFRGFRLDWLRLQCSMACASSPIRLADNGRLVAAMNSAYLHTVMVDDVENFMRQSALPTLPWYYLKSYRNMFERCLSNESQHRFSLAFVQLCDAFCFAGSQSVPHERAAIGREAANLANKFIDEISLRASNTVNQMAKLHAKLGEELLPSTALNRGQSDQASSKKPPAVPSASSQDKDEDIRRQLQTHQHTLASLCWALNHKTSVVVFNYAFCPREFIKTSLSQWFGRGLMQLMNDHPDGPIIRPSRLLSRVKAYLASIRTIESFLNIEVSSVFSSGLLDQTLIVDTAKTTFATDYSKFYVDMLLQHVANGTFLYSESRNCFVSKSSAPFAAESFTDANELQALCLLLGPLGIKQLGEQVVRIAAGRVGELKKIVVSNGRLLEILLTNTQDAPECNDAVKKIKDVDEFTSHASFIGVTLCFRKMLLDAMTLVLESRIPFVFNAIQDLKEHVHGSETVDLLAATAGITSNIDPVLVRAFQPLITSVETDFTHWMLMMGMYAVSIRNIALSSITFHSNLEAFDNNTHCLAHSLAYVSSTLFTLTARDRSAIDQTILNGQQAFLKVASILMLRLGSTREGASAKGRDTALVILQKVVETAPSLTADTLEQFLPYSLVRSAFHSVYARKAAKGRKLEETSY